MGRVVAVVLLTLVLASGWVGFRVYQAAAALREARSAASLLQDGLSTGEVSASGLATVQRASARAATASSDPLWRLAEVVPVAGTQLRSVRVVSSALSDVTNEVVPPLEDVLGRARAGGLRTADGRIDVAAVQAMAPGLARADEVAARARSQVDSLDTRGLIGPLAGPVAQVQDVLGEVAGTTHAASTVASLAPVMLGADGPRTYLVLALNSAELRSAGGIVGAVTAIHVDHGAVTLGAQLSTRDLPKLADPVLPLTEDELAVAGDRIGRWVQDSTLTPDFPRTGQLVAARWVAAQGGTVDGVVSLDAPGVAQLLAATGPVVTSDGQTLTSDGFVAAVLQAPYQDEVDAGAVDRMFADVAGAVFRSVLGGSGDQRALLTATRTVAADGRLRIWSAHAEEQAVLEPTQVGAAFLSGPFPTAVGVFLNDATAGKLDYYLTTSLEVVDTQCAAGAGTATLRLTLTYRPPDGVAGASQYLRGPGLPGVPPGDLATSILIAVGQGDQVGPITEDGVSVGGRELLWAGRGTQTLTSLLAPGQAVTYEVQVPVHGDHLDVWATPTITQGGHLSASCAPVSARPAATNG